MNDAKVTIQITSGRTLMQGRAIEKGKTSQEYHEAVAVCEMNKNSMNALDIENGDTVLIESAYGHTLVRGKLDRNLPDGIAFMPCGPYFNSLITSDTQHSGMPSYKSVNATIKPAKNQKIPSIAEMSNRTRRVEK